MGLLLVNVYTAQCSLQACRKPHNRVQLWKSAYPAIFVPGCTSLGLHITDVNKVTFVPCMRVSGKIWPSKRTDNKNKSTPTLDDVLLHVSIFDSVQTACFLLLERSEYMTWRKNRIFYIRFTVYVWLQITSFPSISFIPRISLIGKRQLNILSSACWYKPHFNPPPT